MFLIRGYSLIELIIVIALIAVLAAASMSFLGPGQQRYGRDARRQADLQSIASAVELYRTDNGTYPPGSSWASLTTILTGTGYLRNVPTDVTTGRQYAYTSYYFGGAGAGPTPCVAPNRCPGFALCAALERNTTPIPASYPVCGSCGGAVSCSFRVTNP
ncbi:hypothetical protein A2634_03595 [Candidatus Amesbacteria bacterium RIFCSPHIGHO2_01_FULL_48_32]|uniref:Type II secretion system protein GspG C-terminal domain-containing protein n=1 Tax=Candidatus Amesbacteria bacterium RIFCSPLOWO2_01_FULL_48_25 TaxID=1797259 RepID=A0A1F4ZBV2_9BACT|nr:MAG: hypothetical protein A2634_03595 [Candidatus Amesbacteria bacterium RIFCSPHIGHO2_01_FULL_48_32]OGD03762.1 MAG: hypothetical protein A2989_03715 [Candidatus Amesbacteria bacterium RIFCSPLOWO2_01_FULL_48_25]HJZ05131.1 prepilin-type N-terminal cleavage/methylation domain-containing protein [Patescibacteria group bacterium]